MLGAIAAACLVRCSVAISGGLVPAPNIDPSLAEIVELGVLHQVNEISKRRRLTTLFVNEQSPFYGVQINYVNVRRGNLTFLIRDLVRLDRIPIVFGRVYDSSARGGDFGPGWKLSVAESVRRTERGLVYTDASGSEYTLLVEGDHLRSAHAHLTGIEQGRIRDGAIDLQVGDLSKRFRRIGNGYFLDAVRDRFGNVLTIEYAGDQIVAVSSPHARSVKIRRDGSGRVIAARDDAGRTVAYEYDADGVLAAVIDVGGNRWQMRYDGGKRLSQVVDPRGLSALTASHDEAGRTRTVQVLYDSMSFEYARTQTTVRNALQQSAVFWHDASGLTRTVQDFAGEITELTFDSDLHPVALSFNGDVMAELRYGRNGRLRAVGSLVGMEPSTSVYEYDAAGQLTSVHTNGKVAAQYDYDAAGNIASVLDWSGYRAYVRDASNRIRKVTFGGAELTLSVNELGLLTGFANEYQRVRIAYDARDQVQGLRFSMDGDEYENHYDYGRSGLRIAGDYVFRPGADGAEAAPIELAATFAYDTIGNLTGMAQEGPDDLNGSQTYQIGDNNQRVKLIGSHRPDLAFDYDSVGRPVRAVMDRNETRYEYDALGRLSGVYVNGEPLLASDYGPMDVDAATEADGQTPLTAVPTPVASAVFGTLETIAYGRSSGTPFGPIRFSASMARFVLSQSLVPAPDAAELTSLQRRALPLTEKPVRLDNDVYTATAVMARPDPMAFDKPSNALFLPPEFSSLNCYYCIPWVFAGSPLQMKVNGTTSGTPVVSVGQTVNIAVSSTNLPWACLADIPGYGTVQEAFVHFFSFGDGTAAQLTNYAINASVNHAYSLPGLYQVVDTIYCTTCFYPVYPVSQLQRSVLVVVPQCDVDFGISPGTPLISTAPAMPSIVASVTSLTPSNASVSWTASISHTAPGGNCSGGPTFTSNTATGSGISFTPVFNGMYGGQLTVTATCSAPGYASNSTMHAKTVGGTQPSDAQVIAQIGTMGSPFEASDLRRIGCHESSLRQFESNGLPLYGGNGDAGIMQICYGRTNRDLWDWRTNIESGRLILNTARNSAQNHLDNEVDNEGATLYTTQMWREEGIHRYNAGTGSGNEYREWNGQNWIVVDRGGVGGYVPAVLAMSGTCT